MPFEFKKEKNYRTKGNDFGSTTYSDFQPFRRDEAKTFKNIVKNIRLKHRKPIDEDSFIDIDIDRDYKVISFKKRF